MWRTPALEGSSHLIPVIPHSMCGVDGYPLFLTPTQDTGRQLNNPDHLNNPEHHTHTPGVCLALKNSLGEDLICKVVVVPWHLQGSSGSLAR